MGHGIEELLEMHCWVIDFLPDQVPAGDAGQVFEVERFLLREPLRSDLRRRFAGVLLRLNCYAEIRVCDPEKEEWQRNPPPEQLFSLVVRGEKDLCVLLPEEDALLTVRRDELCMAVHHPPEKLLSLLERLAAGEGLYLWRPPQTREE